MKITASVRFTAILFVLLMFTSFTSAGISVNMLTWEGYAPEAQVRYFEAVMTEKYSIPVSLNVDYVNSEGEYLEGIKNGSVDVLAPSHNIIKDYRYKLIDKSLLLPIDLNNIPNYTKIIPSLQRAEYCTDEGRVYSVPLVHGPYGLAYNSQLVQPAPTSWNVLWEPKFKKRYAISLDYSEVNIYVTALAMGFPPSDLSNVQALANPDLESKLTQLIKNANNLWRGVDKAANLENNLIGAAWGFSFPALAKQGQVWKMAEPEEGTTGWVDGHAISNTLINKPLHKKVAEEWINFTLSDEFQLQVIVRGIGSAPVNLSIKTSLTSEEHTKFHLDDADYYANHRILWPTLSKRQRTFMKLLWQKALVNSSK